MSKKVLLERNDRERVEARVSVEGSKNNVYISIVNVEDVNIDVKGINNNVKITQMETIAQKNEESEKVKKKEKKSFFKGLYDGLKLTFDSVKLLVDNKGMIVKLIQKFLMFTSSLELGAAVIAIIAFIKTVVLSDTFIKLSVFVSKLVAYFVKFK